jgi:hypothetical protein
MPESQVNRVLLVEEKPVGGVQVGRVRGDAEGAGTLLYRQTYKEALDTAMSEAESLGASHLVVDRWYREPRFWGYDQCVKGSAYRVGSRLGYQ